MMSDRDRALWQQISELRPQLRRDVRIVVQDYRNERWYLLHDESAGRFIRFNAIAYELLGRLDGDLSLQEIIDLANAGRADDPLLEPDDALQILAQLHGAEVLRGALPLGAQDVLNRYEQSQRYRRRRALSNPLALRIPLLDPDRILNRMQRLARVVFTQIGLWVWAVVVALALVLAIANTESLGTAISAKTLSPYEVLVFWAVFPFIKLLHELGHGLAVKAWGGEVHECGINLLVFMPVPYVDASASWAFRDKRRRALVGAAGILVELFLAALGFLVWLSVEPGIVQEMALNVALIGSISTLLFNGNPLLRFDGYYVLEDLVEVPNLASRSSRYYLYLIQRYVLRLADARSPATAEGEAAWFGMYGLISPLYRLFVLIGIAFYLADEFFIVGVVLASWALFRQVLKPLYMSVRFLLTSPRLEARRVRGVALLGLLGALLAGVLWLPAPLVTEAQGVVWLDEKGQVVTKTHGFVAEVMVSPGQRLAVGDPVLRLDDPELEARRSMLEARLNELQTERASQRRRSRVRAAMVEDDIAAVTAELDQIGERISGLMIKSAAAGRFYPRDPHELQGKYLQQGQLVGYVLHDGKPIVRAVLSQDRVELLRSRLASAEVMLANRLGTALPAEMLREVPAGSKDLPSIALGAAGGGAISVDGSDETGKTATENLFQFDLSLPVDAQVAGIGERAYVRLQHGREPLWQQWTRSLQQLLLSRLKV